MSKGSFILYNSHFEQLEFLTMEERGELLTAIICYTRGENYSAKSTAVKVLLPFITAQLDRDKAKYLEECERNAKNGEIGKQFGHLGKEFGKLGGRPCKSYEEIMSDFGLSDIVKKKVWAIIQGQQLNYKPIKNDKLKTLLEKVSKCVDDESKIKYLTIIQDKGNDLNQ